MSMTIEEEMRIRRLEEQVNLLEKRLDELIDGMVSTIRDHPIWKHKEVPFIPTEIKDKTEKKNTERINNDIIRDIRENLGIGPDDTSKDDEINRMSPDEIFNRWCEWNGFIAYHRKFKRVIGDIYGIDIWNRHME
jgi:hypothetical protein